MIQPGRKRNSLGKRILPDACCSLLAIGLLTGIAWAETRPNVVVIYFDDTGWTDFGCYGGKVQTPAIDRLASEGMRFTSYYAPAPNCSPSRTGLMTGRFPFRVGMYSYMPPDSIMHLPDSEVTIAEILQSNGYATGAFGKWHLSLLDNDQQPDPSDQGFDYWFCCDNNLVKQNPRKLIRNGTAVTKTDGWAAQVVADEANAWISKQDKPFFAYIAFSETHSPHDAPPELTKKYRDLGEKPKRAVYKGMTEYTDRAVGSILQTLDDIQATDDTLVFLASDNGPTDPASCRGLRGKKSFTWEGGIRVPAIVRWPGRVPAGTVSDAVVGGIDLLPTLCAVLDQKLPACTIDGINILPILENRPVIRHQPILTFFYRTSPAASMRLGDYVLIAHSDDEARPKTHALTRPDMPRIKVTQLVEFELYNIKNDLAQTKDLAHSEPKTLEKMRDLMIRLHREAIAEGPIWELPQR